jgi:ubiquinone/menaquinone biosynthesis C-methylase UbiE
LSLKHWETYYRGGLLSTCPTTPAGGYDQELESVWTDFLSKLPDGSVVLDIGTGNGAVVQIIADTARGLSKSWEIHGTDLAQIDPLRHVADADKRFSGCRFHPGVATERLPFEAESIDALCGHYALEYSEPEAAIGEVARVLKPGGRAQFVTHHVDSLLARNARQTMAEAEIVLGETRIYRRLRRLVAMDDHQPSRDHPAARALQGAIRRLKEARAELARSGQGRVVDVALDAVRQLLVLRRSHRAEKVTLEVDRAEEEMRLSVRRLQDLLERALDDEGIDSLKRLAESDGLVCEESAPQYHAGDNLVGWRLRFVKPNGS